MPWFINSPEAKGLQSRKKARQKASCVCVGRGGGGRERGAGEREKNPQIGYWEPENDEQA